MPNDSKSTAADGKSGAPQGGHNAAPASSIDAANTDPGLAEKQQMVEKLFQHTNQFLREHKEDPLLVVEALGAIVVRYAALLGPVEQMDDRLAILERLIAQECAQIKKVAKAANSQANTLPG